MNALAQQLRALSAWLARHRPLWSERPFIQQPLSWERDQPEVAAWLRGLDDGAIDMLDEDPARLRQGPAELARWVDEGLALTAVTAAAQGSTTPLRERWERQVPGRKRAQVRAMVGAIRAQLSRPPPQWIDWCAGKGHLGRGLGLCAAAPVLFVERQAALCAEAERRARAEGVEGRALVADVLVSEVALPESGWLVALHACGALSDTALGAAMAAHTRRIALVPCCYHYHPGHARLPIRSRAGNEAPLDVVPRQLRFATAEEVAAPGRRRRGRKREEAFRLAYDLLARQATGQDSYHHLPPLPRRWLRLSFAQWLEQVGREHPLSLPPHYDAAKAEQRGIERARTARALGLARTPFRRALEMWLVLDRALWLADHGYRVRVEQLCPRAISPRNLLISGERVA